MSSIKVIVMGVGGVGKSAITNRFVVGRWIAKYDPTIEESYQTTIDVDGKAFQVEILDTAGQDAYTPLRETFMHTGDGFLLVYSIVDDQTLEELRDIREQILRVHPDKKVPMMVIGNKIDIQKDRAVSKEEGKALAEDFGAGFLEVSAKENFKVKDAFQMLIKRILTKKPKLASQDADNISGVFGGGKLDSSDSEVTETKKKQKSAKELKKENSGNQKSSAGGSAKDKDKEKEKKGKCVLL